MDLVDNIQMSTSVICFFLNVSCCPPLRKKTGTTDICETGKTAARYRKVEHLKLDLSLSANPHIFLILSFKYCPILYNHAND